MITTTKYGLKIPQDNDSADLRIYVGDNMNILDGHTHAWADITGKPTTFTPPLASTTVVGGGLVGNGLGMSGSYLYVKTASADGTKINTAGAYNVAIDRSVVDTWYALKTHTHLWADITDKPTTFTPSAHTHLWADITDKPTAFTPTAHTHLWADITDKPTTFTPTLMSGSAVGGAMVGNGLAMSGNYLFVKTLSADGTKIDTTNNSIAIDRTTVDTWYALKTHTHLWADITDKPTTFTPPIATATVLGGIKVGSGLTIDGTGLLSATATAYTLPIASATVLGGIKVGTGLTIDGTGILSATATAYTLPTASATVLGGIKIGTGLSIDANGVVSATATGGTTYTLPPATATTLGGVMVGSGLTVDGTGLLSVGSLNYLPLAGGTVTGAVQINNQLNINAINNSLIQTQPLTTTVWYGIMKDATTYSYAMGRFTANSDNIDLRAYMGNITIMTGRSSTATTADITLQTNQTNATTVTSQNIHLMPNTSVGTAGYTKVWSALNVTGQITQNGGLNVIQQSSVAGTGAILNVWTGTQAQYDGLTKDASTVYYIVG